MLNTTTNGDPRKIGVERQGPGRETKREKDVKGMDNRRRTSGFQQGATGEVKRQVGMEIQENQRE